MKTFAERAQNALNLGFSIIPIQPNGKGPVTKLAGNGAASRTRNVDLINAWGTELPDGNIGVCADENITILESDDEEKFRRAVRDISKQMFGGARELPETLTSQARENRPHWFFKNSALTKSREESPGVAGMYEWRHRNQYVVGPGSIHPSGSTYQLVNEVPIAEMPDWLVGVLDTMKKAYRGETNAASTFVKVGPAGTLIDAYSSRYNFDIEKMLADESFRMEVQPGERHYFLMSMAGVLHDGDREEHEIMDLLLRLQEKYCIGAKGDEEVRRVASWIIKREPCAFGPAGHWLGLTWFRDENDYLKAKLSKFTESVIVETESTTVERTPYPIEVWSGTEYHEYAELCSKGNYIPKEFFVETLKTMTGAIMGSSIKIKNLLGGSPRFYTVLIGDGGSGKGTAVGLAQTVFEERWDGLDCMSPLLWDPVIKIEDVPWKTIGACKVGFSSSPGMQRVSNTGHLRWLQVYEEFSSWVESAGIEGSGQSLLAAQRQLYDADSFSTTATAKRDAGGGKALNSLIGATTPELWEDMFSGTRSEGSGLFQRLVIVGIDGSRRVPSLFLPDLSIFRARLCSRIAGLDGQSIQIPTEEAAQKLVAEWHSQDRYNSGPADDTGRLNLLVWKNALHLAWLHDSGLIRVKDIEGGIKLAEHQYVMRQLYKPAEGNNYSALMEDKLRKLLRNTKRIGEREAKRKLHADRYGLKIWESTVRGLVTEEEIFRVSEKHGKNQTLKSFLLYNENYR